MGSRRRRAPTFRHDLSVGLIPVGLVAVMTQPQCAAQFVAETAALGGITSVALGASGVLALGASGVLALGAPGVLALGAPGVLALGAPGVIALGAPGVIALGASGVIALGAPGVIRCGCRRLDVRRGSDLRRFGPRRPRFRGRGWPSACRTRLFSHAHHATGYGLRARIIAARSASTSITSTSARTCLWPGPATQ